MAQKLFSVNLQISGAITCDASVARQRGRFAVVGWALLQGKWTRVQGGGSLTSTPSQGTLMYNGKLHPKMMKINGGNYSFVHE